MKKGGWTRGLVQAIACAWLAGCGDGRSCETGRQVECACVGGARGAQVCSDGRYGACLCAQDVPTVDAVDDRATPPDAEADAAPDRAEVVDATADAAPDVESGVDAARDGEPGLDAARDAEASADVPLGAEAGVDVAIDAADASPGIALVAEQLPMRDGPCVRWESIPADSVDLLADDGEDVWVVQRDAPSRVARYRGGRWQRVTAPAPGTPRGIVAGGGRVAMAFVNPSAGGEALVRVLAGGVWRDVVGLTPPTEQWWFVWLAGGDVYVSTFSGLVSRVDAAGATAIWTVRRPASAVAVDGTRDRLWIVHEDAVRQCRETACEGLTAPAARFEGGRALGGRMLVWGSIAGAAYLWEVQGTALAAQSLPPGCASPTWIDGVVLGGEHVLAVRCGGVDRMYGRGAVWRALPALPAGAAALRRLAVSAGGALHVGMADGRVLALAPGATAWASLPRSYPPSGAVVGRSSAELYAHDGATVSRYGADDTWTPMAGAPADILSLFAPPDGTLVAATRRGTVERWGGSAWRVEYTIPSVINGADFAGRAANDLWLLTDRRNGLLHWDGARWSDVPLSGICAVSGAVSNLLVTPSSVFVSCRETTFDVAWEFDGSTWTRRFGVAPYRYPMRIGAGVSNGAQSDVQAVQLVGVAPDHRLQIETVTPAGSRALITDPLPPGLPALDPGGWVAVAPDRPTTVFAGGVLTLDAARRWQTLRNGLVFVPTQRAWSDGRTIVLGSSAARGGAPLLTRCTLP